MEFSKTLLVESQYAACDPEDESERASEHTSLDKKRKRKEKRRKGEKRKEDEGDWKQERIGRWLDG